MKDEYEDKDKDPRPAMRMLVLVLSFVVGFWTGFTFALIVFI